MAQASKRRIVELDVFRYLTVSFAVASHAIIAHSIYGDDLYGWALIGKTLTRSATPCLIILFGMMVEMVYMQKFQRDFRAASAAVLHRVVLCYFAFIGLALAAFLFSGAPLLQFLAAFPLISPAENGNIFKIYIFLLLLIFPLYFIRRRFGSVGLVTFAMCLWALHFLLIDRFSILPYPLHHLGGLLFAIGDEWGPSVLHAVALVVFGMLLQSAIFSVERNWTAVVLVVLTSLGSAMYLLAVGFSEGWQSVATNIADANIWRDNNHLGYYAYGVVASLMILASSYALPRVLPLKILKPAVLVGGATLMYFFLANLFISIVPNFAIADAWLSVAVVAAYVIISTIATLLWLRFGRPSSLAATFNSVILTWSLKVVDLILARSIRSRGATTQNQ